MATSLRNARGVAATCAVSIVRALVEGEDWKALREAVRAEVDRSAEGWTPTTLSLDGATVSAEARAMLDLAWAAAAELPDCFLAVAGSDAMAIGSLRFGYVPDAVL
jgi:hypothetical protein